MSATDFDAKRPWKRVVETTGLIAGFIGSVTAIVTAYNEVSAFAFPALQRLLGTAPSELVIAVVPHGQAGQTPASGFSFDSSLSNPSFGEPLSSLNSFHICRSPHRPGSGFTNQVQSSLCLSYSALSTHDGGEVTPMVSSTRSADFRAPSIHPCSPENASPHVNRSASRNGRTSVPATSHDRAPLFHACQPA